ncbi:Uncharacterised protein [Mycobacteroides abscessus subsp. abscessus]|nr:Uncharacterised protein [Mycobacteroides abscessus subsp. abscessus]
MDRNNKRPGEPSTSSGGTRIDSVNCWNMNALKRRNP